MDSDEKLTIHAENDEELERTIRVHDIDDDDIPIRTETLPNKPQATRKRQRNENLPANNETTDALNTPG